MPSWASSMRGEGEIALKSPVVMGCRRQGRHALGGAQEIARPGRDYPLLAGQQSDLLLAL
jgi:hypothetical protein